MAKPQSVYIFGVVQKLFWATPFLFVAVQCKQNPKLDIIAKMKKFGIVAMFFVGFSIFAQQNTLSGDDIDFWSDMPSEKLSTLIVSKMTDEELLSQILMFGWAGQEPNPLLYHWVGGIGLGSVKIFGWNTDDIHLVAKSIASLQKSAASRRFKIPLFVATDQEGGWIRHVKGETLVTPGNMAIGASGYPVDAWYSAYYISREIKALGINMNFAPSVDLFTNQNSTIIGTRSFGNSPENAGILGQAWASGSQAAGVIPTAKHFPGHGDTEFDSHIHLPVIDIDFETFTNRELSPFVYLIKNGIPAIMSGHLAFPKIDPSGAPASLSKYFLTDLLRTQLGFDGLIITDDMMMSGDTIYAGSLSNAFKMAIEAGNDIVISSRTAGLDEALWVNSLSLMRTNPLFKERVSDAAYRVVKAKLDYFKGKNPAPLYPDPAKISLSIPDKDGDAFFLGQACRSVTKLKASSIPISAKDSGNVLLTGSLPGFFRAGKKRFPDSDEYKFSYELGPNETLWVTENLPGVVKKYDTVIVCVSSERSALIAKSLKGSGKKVVVLSIMTPTNSDELMWASDVLAGYSYSDYTFDALFGALCGEFESRGKKPF